MAITQSVSTPQVPPLGAPGNSSPTTASAGTTSQTTKDSLSIGKTFDQFLTLLTTQLKNQDPLSPQDSTQFTSQLVQFSQVEQEINNFQSRLATLEGRNLSQEGWRESSLEELQLGHGPRLRSAL